MRNIFTETPSTEREISSLKHLQLNRNIFTETLSTKREISLLKHLQLNEKTSLLKHLQLNCFEEFYLYIFLIFQIRLLIYNYYHWKSLLEMAFNLIFIMYRSIDKTLKFITQVYNLV